MASVYLSAPLSLADLLGAITFMVKRSEVGDRTRVSRVYCTSLMCGGKSTSTYFIYLWKRSRDRLVLGSESGKKERDEKTKNERGWRDL